jgi:hypothetical protein
MLPAWHGKLFLSLVGFQCVFRIPNPLIRIEKPVCPNAASVRRARMGAKRCQSCMRVVYSAARLLKRT